jgi:hypothetical protein
MPIADIAKNEAIIRPLTADLLNFIVEFFNLCIFAHSRVGLPFGDSTSQSATSMILFPVQYAVFATAFIIASYHLPLLALGI